MKAERTSIYMPFWPVTGDRDLKFRSRPRNRRCGHWRPPHGFLTGIMKSIEGCVPSRTNELKDPPCRRQGPVLTFSKHGRLASGRTILIA
jgi:hypothetical protein